MEGVVEYRVVEALAIDQKQIAVLVEVAGVADREEIAAPGRLGLLFVAVILELVRRAESSVRVPYRVALKRPPPSLPASTSPTKNA